MCRCRRRCTCTCTCTCTWRYSSSNNITSTPPPPRKTPLLHHPPPAAAHAHLPRSGGKCKNNLLRTTAWCGASQQDGNGIGNVARCSAAFARKPMCVHSWDPREQMWKSALQVTWCPRRGGAVGCVVVLDVLLFWMCCCSGCVVVLEVLLFWMDVVCVGH